MNATAERRAVGRYRTFTEITALVRAFEDASLPREEWTHQAHLTVALWYLLTRPRPEQAVACIRDGLRRYVRAHGIVETPEGGYHETLTLFWIRVVSRQLAESDLDCALAVLANRVIAHCADKGLPLAYYSRERLWSPEARAGWVEPDLQPLE
jgi:hypothetical protein